MASCGLLIKTVNKHASVAWLHIQAHKHTMPLLCWLAPASILPEVECSIKTNGSIARSTECLSAEKLHRSPR